VVAMFRMAAAGRPLHDDFATTMVPAIRISTADIVRLTVPTRVIAAKVAMHGGNTFHTNMFSTVNTAFDVAVIRLVSMP
ncbi:hypothetical protein, partial [Escherichia coli]|uniref:hypothetical protein n=1 Tax=Escherichia coli TaxID=562 RepID=UPI00215B2CF5